MKNRIVTLIMSLIVSMTAGGQLTPEKVYDYSLTSTKINQTDYKYFLMDVGGSQCRIYNTDHTLWKTIPVSLPSGYYLYDIRFVTQNLFNSDGLIELWYSAYEWVSTGTSTGYYRYMSKVINEGGNVLATIQGGAYAFIIQAGAESFKLVVYAYDNSVTPYTVKTHLFSLPNSPTALNFLSALPGDPFPNPAGDYINLPVDGSGMDAVLQIYTLSGEKMTEEKIGNRPFYQLNTSGWAPGVYSYRQVTKGRPTQTKQFVIQ